MISNIYILNEIVEYLLYFIWTIPEIGLLIQISISFKCLWTDVFKYLQTDVLKKYLNAEYKTFLFYWLLVLKLTNTCWSSRKVSKVSNMSKVSKALKNERLHNKGFQSLQSVQRVQSHQSIQKFDIVWMRVSEWLTWPIIEMHTVPAGSGVWFFIYTCVFSTMD